MAHVVITLIGDDRSGLVDSVARVVAAHDANWERSHLAELAGKFAGIVLVEVAEAAAEDLLRALDGIESEGLLDITAERTTQRPDPVGATHVRLELTGQDHPGIVASVSAVLAGENVSIDDLETAVVPAPQGGDLFVANAVLELPAGMEIARIQSALESVALDLMVDLDLVVD